MQCGQILPNFKDLCFALTTNGMNPFGDFNLKHSTWLDLLLINGTFD
jgi:hypothetical protein